MILVLQDGWCPFRHLIVLGFALERFLPKVSCVLEA